MSEKRLIYLDHSATTPVDARVVDAMMPYFTEVYGNPSSIHSVGRRAEQAVEDSRARIARVLNCKPAEIVFTSGGSESDNLAVRGAAWTMRQKAGRTKLMTTPVEHSAIGRTITLMSDLMDFEEAIIPVGRDGRADAEAYAELCGPDTALVSVMYANNEVGSIQPISQMADIAHTHGALFHTDAVQAAGQLELDVTKLGIDMMSLSAHKFYGPKGVGVLYVRDGVDLVPSQSGGSHERGRRAGTHNTPFIIGMAVALELACIEREERVAHYLMLREALIEQILARVPDAHLTGHRYERLPSHASFVFDGIDGNKLLIHLDMRGVCASSASACKTGNPEPSGVLLAMGYGRDVALSSLRLSVGKDMTLEDVEYAVQALAESVQALRKLNRKVVH